MKKVSLLTLLTFFVSVLHAQQTCSTAALITTANTCNFTTHATAGTEHWLKFVATSPTVNISLITVKFGINSPHIHNLALLTGSCGSPVLIAEDELPFESDAKELSIDLNASGLIIGQSYYIRAIRFATEVGRTCDKSGCTVNNSTDPTVFDICVEDINVIIPKDFGLELPSISYSFQTNRGQIIDLLGNKRPEIKLFTRTNPAVFIADDKVSYVFNQDDDIIGTPDAMHRVDMTLIGANIGRKVFKTEKMEGVTNYYLDHTPLGLTANKDYSRTVTTDIYPNIDMQWYSNSLGEKLYFIVKPTGDPNSIIMQFDGATSVTALPNGALKVTTPLGNIEYEPPHAYRVNPAGNVVPMPWQAKFQNAGANKVKIQTHPYDPIMDLYIQIDKGHQLPSSAQAIDNLTWSTYFNGAGDDIAYDVTTDAAENVYVIGTTSSAALSFPQSPGAHQTQLSGLRDAFISRFDIGAVRKFSTFYGGTSTEEGYGIAVGSTNNLYITGTSGSSSFPSLPTNNGVYVQPTGHSGFNGYIAEMDALLGTVLWQSYFGGAAEVKGYKLAIDNANNIFLTGRVRYTTNIATATGGVPPAGGASGGFPILTPITAYVDNAFDFLSIGSGGLGTSDHDAFIAKFNSNNQLEWSTLYGGQKFDDAKEIAIDPISQDVIITGNTKTNLISNDICGTPSNGGFPLCNGSGSPYYQNTWNSMGGFGSSYIARFNNIGELKWSTYFDGLAGGLVFNSVGDFYVSGITQTSTSSQSTTAPTNSAHPVWAPGAAFGQNYAGNWDVYINKFNTSNQMTWGTYYGGTTEETNSSVVDELGETDLAVDSKNIVYLTGSTSMRPSSFNDFPTFQFPTYYFTPLLQPIVDFVQQPFIVAFDKSNQRQWATLYGADSGTGINFDGYDNGIAIATAGNSLFVTGFSHSVDFPFTCPAPTTGTPFCQNYTPPASFDVFLGRFDIATLVGINEELANNHNLLVYPNPTANELNIEFYIEDKSDINIAIHNVVGQKIYAEQVRSCFGKCKKKISTENLANGVYVISINFEEGTVVKKIIKQ